MFQNILEYKSAYFVGIGGIGMSALAQYLQSLNIEVYGYDKTPSPATGILKQKKIPVTFTDEVSEIHPDFKSKAKDTAIIIYTPAIPKTNTILAFFRAENFTLKKRAEVLGMISQKKQVIAVAGTHGKTTTSSMISHVLHHSGFGCSALIGGIMNNYKNNLLISQKNDILVVEADEYDRSFHQLFPHFASVSSCDIDHIDIYENQKAIVESFQKFIGNTSGKGMVLLHEKTLPFIRAKNQKSYGFSEACDFQIDNKKIENGFQIFSVKTPEKIISDIKIKFPGDYNLENACVAVAFAIELGIEPEKIKKALENFKGVKRRFETHFENENTVFIDDYAHHPEEINALQKAIRTFYPNKKIAVAFQPHTFSRTQQFMKEFGESLSQFDHVFLLPIYAARELPIDGITSEALLATISISEKNIIDSKNVPDALIKTGAEVLVTLGAGDIFECIPEVVEKLRNEKVITRGL